MVTIKHTAILAAAALTAAAIGPGTHASAQTIQGGFELRVSNVVSPSQPTATVEVWAWFDNVPGVSELFASGNYDLVAGEGLWSNVTYWLNAPDPPPHLVVGSRINNLIAGQLHLPPVNIFGNPSNPVLVLSTNWTTTDFTNRGVLVETANTSFFNVYNQHGVQTLLWPSGYSPGSAAIAIVPAPPVMVVVTGFAILAGRRRRKHENVLSRFGITGVL